MGLRARVGLRPKRRQAEAGMRMERPRSVAWAAGRIPAATAAEEPPLEPPGECWRFQGLRVGPKRRGSVEGERPISGVLDLPTMIRPARLRRRVRVLSWAATLSSKRALP